MSGAKMMHDFGVSSHHTVIMDLPLSLDCLNFAKNKPAVSYDPRERSRFGVFPRYMPQEIRWFETNPCCIFHAANAWDSREQNAHTGKEQTSVNLLACRLTSASLVFSAGNIGVPTAAYEIPKEFQEVEQCRLYYYQFPMSDLSNGGPSKITHQWALSSIPFEFPTLRDSAAMGPARYIYGCSVSDASFGAALGRAVKISYLAKMDVTELIARGIRQPPTPIKGCVDTRTVEQILSSSDADDPIQVFKLPDGWYAQECRFVPRSDGVCEDDGWILSYVFDESQLDSDGECPPNARSELWVIDARNMRDVVAKIRLPQRVPYGLHGNWFSESAIKNQRPVERIRAVPVNHDDADEVSKERSWPWWEAWMIVRRSLEWQLA